MKRSIAILILFFPLFLSAQTQQTGNLTIFSEDGDAFYLVLNGEKQNNIAQTNLRIEELPQPYYTAKIMFKDSTIQSISKNNLYIASSDGVMKDVTYRIRKDKTGKVKLNYYSMIDVEPGFQPPATVFVQRYGRNAKHEIHTTTTSNTALNASVNVNGVSMNVSINDPLINHNTTTTTTTTTTTHSNDNNGHRKSRKCDDEFPMRSNDFTAAKASITDASFDESKLTIAKGIASSNCMSASQIAEVAELFSFEESKLDFAKFAYKFCTDQKNYFKVNTVFSFDSSKEELSKLTTNN